MASLYSCAANVVDKVIKKQGTAKSLAIKSPFPRKKKLYALVCETLKCKCVVNSDGMQTDPPPDLYNSTRLLENTRGLGVYA